jgi:flavin-dependent dehydrogenase
MAVTQSTPFFNDLLSGARTTAPPCAGNQNGGKIGLAARELLGSKSGISGVLIHGADVLQKEIQAKLVVGADGRQTRIAELAGLAAKWLATLRLPLIPYRASVAAGLSNRRNGSQRP